MRSWETAAEPPTAAETLARWTAWLWTPNGLAYIARRVRVEAAVADHEQRAYDAWFAGRRGRRQPKR